MGVCNIAALGVGVIFTLSILSSNVDTKIVKIGPNGPVLSRETAGDDKSIDNESELFNMMGNPDQDDVGKAVPQKIISGGIPMHHPQSPDRNWGRRMNEEQWRQHHSRLNRKAYEVNKKVMHNRNTINDNRHDRKGMKISRHVD